MKNQKINENKMEENEITKLWEDQNVLLKKSTSLNEPLLETIFTRKANGIIESLLKWEYFSLIEFLIFLIFTSICTYKFSNDLLFLVSGIFLIIFLSISLFFTYNSILKLKSISLYSDSIVKLKKDVLDLQKRNNKFWNSFLFCIPTLIVAFLLLGVRFIRGVNLLDHSGIFTSLSIGIILISYIIAFISHRTIYTRRYHNIDQQLLELQKFRNQI